MKDKGFDFKRFLPLAAIAIGVPLLVLAATVAMNHN
jgi:hypothetical protein